MTCVLCSVDSSLPIARLLLRSTEGICTAYRLKRAGLDYWPYVCVNVHDSWAAFLAEFDAWPEPKRLVAYSKFAKQHYAVDSTYRAGDVLLFGAETHGLPDGVRLVHAVVHRGHAWCANAAVLGGLAFLSKQVAVETHTVCHINYHCKSASGMM